MEVTERLGVLGAVAELSLGEGGDKEPEMCPADLAMADPASIAYAHRTQDQGRERDGDVFSMDIEAQIEYVFSCAVLVVHPLVRLAAAQHRFPNVRIGFARSSPRFTCSQHSTPFSRTRAAPMACSRRLDRSHKVSANH